MLLSQSQTAYKSRYLEAEGGAMIFQVVMHELVASINTTGIMMYNTVT